MKGTHKLQGLEEIVVEKGWMGWQRGPSKNQTRSERHYRWQDLSPLSRFSNRGHPLYFRGTSPPKGR
jgi:hypothetical protein